MLHYGQLIQYKRTNRNNLTTSIKLAHLKKNLMRLKTSPSSQITRKQLCRIVFHVIFEKKSPKKWNKYYLFKKKQDNKKINF